jgi:hypothetical protein
VGLEGKKSVGRVAYFLRPYYKSSRYNKTGKLTEVHNVVAETRKGQGQRLGRAMVNPQRSLAGVRVVTGRRL